MPTALQAVQWASVPFAQQVPPADPTSLNPDWQLVHAPALSQDVHKGDVPEAQHLPAHVPTLHLSLLSHTCPTSARHRLPLTTCPAGQPLHSPSTLSHDVHKVSVGSAQQLLLHCPVKHWSLAVQLRPTTRPHTGTPLLLDSVKPGSAHVVQSP